MKNLLLSTLLTLMTFSAFAQTVTVNPDPVVFGYAATNVTITVQGAASSTDFELFTSESPTTALLTADSGTTPALTSVAGGAIITITFTVAVTGGDAADVILAEATSQLFGIFKDAGGGITASAVINSQLPIELKSFDAKNEANNVNLAWTTSMEENNEFFTLERSFDGKEFDVVTKINGAGDSAEDVTYTFSDENVTRIATANTAYYRLKQTDFDGAFTYSNIISVNLENRDELEVTNISVVGNELSVNFVAPTEGATEISIYDLTGRMIATNNQVATEGYNTTNLALNANQTGIFIVRITNGQTQTIRKVMK